MKLVIIDYGAGNTKSVQFAFERLGYQIELSDNREVLLNADGVVFPGVGNAGPAAGELEKRGLNDLVRSLKVPVLGICLGMQLLCDKSEEEASIGLGVFQENVLRFTGDVKVPQIGWNSIDITDNALLEDLEEGAFMYFVHSYFMPVNKYTISSATYGQKFSAIVQKDNFYACQFHPEKSGKAGEQLLKNFIKICESYQQ